MGVEVVEGMEWLLWLIKKTAWLLEPWGKALIMMMVVVCVLKLCGFRVWRPKK
jgi:hypothetical protein